MFKNYRFTAAERFLRYVQIDTQSDPQSSSYPTTEKQKQLSLLLADELKQMGVTDAHMDEWVMYMLPFLPIPIKKFQ
jgi:tripeptide aminopeptidase